MEQSDLDGRRRAAHERLRPLERRAGTLPATEKALLDEVLEQLAIEVEELRVARDELVHQNEQLAEAQRTIELERLVRERTAALHGANDALEREVSVRRRAQAEQEKFVRLVESASDFIGMADLDGHMVYLNPVGLRMAGLDRMEDVLTTPMSDYWTEDTWTYVRETGLPEVEATGRWYGEGQVLNRKTGGAADVEIHLLIVTTPHSEGSPCLCIVQHDVSERKRVECLKNEFVSMVSHELRTPLTSIGGSLGLLAGGVAGELPPEARGMVEIAYRNSERLLRLINDLLDIDKIESGRVDFVPRPLDILPLIEHAIAINVPYAEQFSVRFALEGDAPGAKVLVDPDRLLQIRTNLLSNAAKFFPRGGTVRVGITPENGRLCVTVSDQGPGIPEEFRPRIFQKFAQADASDSRQRGGTGLGLSIARALVERMGGRIGFDMQTGRGTTFHFDLPHSGRQRKRPVWSSPRAESSL